MSPKCASCGKDNKPDAKYCVFCGMLLPEPAQPELSKETPQQDEIAYLRELLEHVSSRLDRLEKTPESVDGPAPAPPPPPTRPQPEVKPAPAPDTTPAPPAPPLSVLRDAPLRKPREPREWEMILGGSWLARIGVLALIFAAGFFLKYAFDRNWIGPEARVIIGVVFGIIMVWMGHVWRDRYPIMTRVLSGGGIAITYLAIFAAFSFYGFLNYYIAVFLLLLVSAGGAALAIRYRSRSLVVLAMLGAFFAPFFLGLSSEYEPGIQTGGEAAQLMGYMVIITIGFLLLSRYRNWHPLSLLVFVFTGMCFTFWYSYYEDTISSVAGVLGLTALFLIFLGNSLFNHVTRRRRSRVDEDLLFVITGALFALIGPTILAESHDGWIGLFVFLVAVLYLCLSPLILSRNEKNSLLSRYSFIMGLVALTASIPVQFQDAIWTSLLWALEALVLLYLAVARGAHMLKYFSYGVFFFMAWHLLIFGTRVDIPQFTPVLNERFPAFLAGIAAFYIGAYLVHRYREKMPEGSLAVVLLVLLANIFTIVLFSLEIWHAFTRSIEATGWRNAGGLLNAQNLSLTGFWLVYGALALAVGFWKRWRYLRLGGLAFLAVSILKVFVYDVFKLDMGYRIGAFVFLGVMLLVSAYLYQRFGPAIRAALIRK